MHAKLLHYFLLFTLVVAIIDNSRGKKKITAVDPQKKTIVLRQCTCDSFNLICKKPEKF